MIINNFPSPFSLIKDLEQLPFETDEIPLDQQVIWQYRISSYDGPRTVIGIYKDQPIICNSWLDDHIYGHYFLVGKLDPLVYSKLNSYHETRKKYYGSTAQEFSWNEKLYCWNHDDDDSWNINQHADLQAEYQRLNLGKGSHELHQSALDSEIIGFISK